MSTLVTGATGFICANVVRALLETGIAVRALVRRDSDRRNLAGLPVDIVPGDLRDSDSLRAALRGCQTLYHVAAHYSLWTPQPQELYTTNVEGTANLMRLALEIGVEKVVYTSSVATISLPADGAPGDETLHLPLT